MKAPVSFRLLGKNFVRYSENACRSENVRDSLIRFPRWTVTPFAYVDTGAYYESAVLWAAAQKIPQVTALGAFSPANPCTRAQIAAFLYGALGK